MLYQLTNNCNLNCEHCLNDSGQNNLHADRIITIKVAKFIIENNINVVVVAGGDPFTHLDAFKRSVPTCFNLLSAAKKCDSLKRTINTIELVGNLCKPMVSYAGDLYVGESLECLIFGNIDDPIDKIFKSLKSLWPCGRCGVNGPYVNLLKRKFSLNEPH